MVTATHRKKLIPLLALLLALAGMSLSAVGVRVQPPAVAV